MFIPQRNPYFNMIEFTFRFIKKELRKKATMK